VKIPHIKEIAAADSQGYIEPKMRNRLLREVYGTVCVIKDCTPSRDELEYVAKLLVEKYGSLKDVHGTTKSPHASVSATSQAKS
jgi:hypothetical protein